MSIPRPVSRFAPRVRSSQIRRLRVVFLFVLIIFAALFSTIVERAAKSERKRVEAPIALAASSGIHLDPAFTLVDGESNFSVAGTRGEPFIQDAWQRTIFSGLPVTNLDVASSEPTVCDGQNYSNDHFLPYTECTGGPMFAITWIPSADETISRAEIFTGFTAYSYNSTRLPNRLAIWSDDGGSPSRPLARLASTCSFNVVPTASWQGANLTTTVSITAGQKYWVVWDPDENQICSGSPDGDGTRLTYWGSSTGTVDGGASWTGPFGTPYQDSQVDRWKFRVFCGDVSPVSPADAGPDQVFCETSSTTMAGNAPATGIGTWTLLSGSATIADPHSATTALADLGYGDNAFRWTIPDGSCGTSSDIVTIIRHQTPTAADAGPDQTFCETSSTTISGNSPAVGVGHWQLVSGVAAIASPNSATTVISNIGYGPNIFEWVITNGACGSSIDYVTITRDQTPTTANAGPDQLLCSGSATTMAANLPTVGVGSWTLVSGSGTINDPQDHLTVVSNLGNGVNVLRWTISDGSCGSFSDDVTITRSSCPTNITLYSNRDSFMRSGADDTNEGANERLRIQNAGDNRAVVAFNLTGVSTVGLQSATLVLTIAENSNNWGNTGRFVDAQRLLVDWIEGNGRNDVMAGGGPGIRGTGSGVTWHCGIDTNVVNQSANCSPLWNGGSFAAATAPGVLHNNGLLGQVSWNVTADVLAGATSGWIVRKREENQNGQVRYYSREGATLAGNANLAPRLVLVYSH